jgi:hypothetical protein
VAHTCNLSYSEDSRHQEGCSSKTALGKHFSSPYLEKIHHKKGLVETLMWEVPA